MLYLLLRTYVGCGCRMRHVRTRRLIESRQTLAGIFISLLRDIRTHMHKHLKGKEHIEIEQNRGNCASPVIGQAKGTP